MYEVDVSIWNTYPKQNMRLTMHTHNKTKYTPRKVATAVKFALMSSLVSMTGISSQAIAQEAAAEEAVEKIAVTGSRIRKSDFVSNAPVATIGAEQFQLTATVNTESLLNTLPQVIPGLDRTSNNPGNGTATVDLRGLGTNRTLVLINGQRVTPTSSAGTVDINSIPTSLIEDVEVLTGGASAVYGSDAVAGVVNFILKDDFEGVSATTSYEASEQGDATVQSVDLTIGGNFADGRGNVAFNMSFTDRGELFQGDRDFASPALFDSGAGLVPGGSTGVPQARIFGNFQGINNSTGTNPGGPGVIFDTNGNARAFIDPADRYDYAPVNYIQLPQTRHQFTALGHYEINDNAIVYARSMFTDSEVPQQLAPTPIFGAETFTLDGNPFLTAETQALLTGNNVDYVGIGVRQAGIFSDTEFNIPGDEDSGFACLNCVFDSTAGLDNPQGFNDTTALIDTDGDGIADLARGAFGRRLEEFGPRFASNTFTSFNFMTGIKGAIGDSNWTYDAYFSTGQVENVSVQLGNVNRDRYSQALILATDSDGQVILDANGNPSCADPAANGGQTGCAPINIFGEGNISQAAVNFISTAVAATATFDQDIFEVSVSGDTEGWFELPGGPVGLAFGGQHIENYFEFLPSQDLAANTIAGFNGSPPVKGAYNVTEYYVEAYLPILEGVAMAELLDLELAWRTSDYSTVGTTDAYKIAGSWAPTEELRFRTGFNKAVRAPNIAELFAPRGEGFPSAFDPCAQEGLPTDADGNPLAPAAGVDAICTGTGVPATALFSSVINSAAGQIRTLTGGNPSLVEEEAETLTFGVVYTPTDDFSISLDYFDIEITQAIAAFGGGTANVLNTCYTPSNPLSGSNGLFCGLVNRFPSGAIDFVEIAQQNVATVTLSGMDLITSYSFDLWDGSFSIDYLGTYTAESDTLPFAGGNQIECAGKFGNVCGEPVPEYKHRTTFKYSTDDYTVQLLWRFVGEVEDDTGGFDVNDIDAESYFDLNASYALTDNFSLAGGVDNLLDTKPPILGGNAQQANTWPATYDVFGRTYYVSLTATF